MSKKKEQFPTVLHAVERLQEGAGFDVHAVLSTLTIWLEEEAPAKVREALIEHLEDVFAEHLEDL